MNNIQKAINFAKKGLRACYGERGIMTGSRQVYWSWDSFFASFGALAVGDKEIVRKNLELYLDNQNNEGNIPKRIAHPLYAFKYLGLPIKELPEKQKPNYSSPYYTGRSLSQGPVFIVAFNEYILRSRNSEFLATNFAKLEKLMEFLHSFTYDSGLLREAIGGGWAESVLKRGAITYTNACYVRSLECMAGLAQKAGKPQREKYYRTEFARVKESMNTKLWEDVDGGFYSDWIGINRHHHFTADGNLLAILWGVTDKAKSAKINKQLDELLEDNEIPIPLTSDRYYFWRIYPANRLAGIKNYHVHFSWIWLGALAAIVKYKTGDQKAAKEILEKIAKVIVRYRSVHEIYLNGRPVKVLMYKSENPWAWSAGMFLYACEKIGYKVKT